MTPPVAKVLLVEDDAAVAANVVRGLRAADFDVELAVDGCEAVRLALRGTHDLMVLDLLLPGQTGFEVLQQLQGKSTKPIIVLTARTELEDRLRCFASGAVDFVAKPFWVEELVARIRSRLQVNPEAPKRVVQWANVHVDLNARTVTVLDAPEVSFTRNEFDILAYLVQRPDRAVSRQRLAERALDPLSDRDLRTVDTHIARIRKKLGASAGEHIRTVWGVGYRFAPAG